MRFLLCAEFFYPSVGGVQEVVKQIGVGLARLGHDVTVATSAMAVRTECQFRGVRIAGFSVSGNLARGLSGDVDSYRSFVCEGAFDAILIYAAQQWTLDALLDVLPDIKARKVLVPCGFSGYYLPEYQSYFKRLANDLKYFDALVFHAREYRDIQFARSLSLENCVLIPNGAGEEEFLNPPESTGFRKNLGISPDAFTILTVGSLNGAKGHLELAKAAALLKTKRTVHVLLNGNSMPHTAKPTVSQLIAKLKGMSLHGGYLCLRHFAWHGLRLMGLRKTPAQELNELVKRINAGKYGLHRHVSIVDLPRQELTQAFFEAGLFVFASKIEYSPLVLFEAAAAGLPFLTTPVGNASEIAEWTGAGRVCAALTDAQGYTSVDSTVLAEEIDQLIEDEDSRVAMGLMGRQRWKEKFTWRVIVTEYEKVMMGRMAELDLCKERSLA